jgi:hypothetical protein
VVLCFFNFFSHSYREVHTIQIYILTFDDETMSSTQTTSPDNADAVDVLHDVNLYGNYNRKDISYVVAGTSNY